MRALQDVIWIETRKAVRSRMPLFTIVAALFMTLGIGFLIFVATHPELSARLGLVSAKANLVAYGQTDWPAYLGLLAMTMAAGGFFIASFIVCWVFGREFVDGTLKDLLAVPIARGDILAAKFIVASVWFGALAALMLVAGLVVGRLMQLPQGSPGTLLPGVAVVTATALLVVPVVTPIALFASIGRGYLLPLGLAILLVVAANFLAVLGWAPYFPWAVPGLYAQAKGNLPGISYFVAGVTGLLGVVGTYIWWKYADQAH